MIPTLMPAKQDLPGKPYYITTAIAYPNGAPHIGHAYEAIATDAIARFMRLDGRDVFFLTGTDEHGIKMLQTAAKENVTPRELVERNVPRFQAMVKRFNCSNDEFIRTTEARHHRSSNCRRCRRSYNRSGASKSASSTMATADATGQSLLVKNSSHSV